MPPRTTRSAGTFPRATATSAPVSSRRGRTEGWRTESLLPRSGRASGSAPVLLDQAAVRKAEVIPPPDDHVIQQGNPKQLPGQDQFFREAAIARAGLGVAGGMVVDQNDGRRMVPVGALQDLPGIDRAFGERA